MARFAVRLRERLLVHVAVLAAARRRCECCARRRVARRHAVRVRWTARSIERIGVERTGVGRTRWSVAIARLLLTSRRIRRTAAVTEIAATGWLVEEWLMARACDDRCERVQGEQRDVLLELRSKVLPPMPRPPLPPPIRRVDVYSEELRCWVTPGKDRCDES